MNTKLNVKLLKQIKAEALKHPTQVNMNHWFTAISPTGVDIKGCGTAGCIAGWACFLHLKEKKKAATLEKALSYLEQKDESEEDMAVHLLGITPAESSTLFLQEYWPNELAARLQNATTPKQYARVVADRIDAFIKENKK